MRREYSQTRWFKPIEFDDFATLAPVHLGTGHILDESFWPDEDDSGVDIGLEADIGVPPEDNENAEEVA